MNHLAHCFLSQNDEECLVGNFMGDFIKGNAWQAYPPGIQYGLLLHRSIDAFTDQHEAIKQSVQRIRPFSGRYSAPLIDILYDHLLARNWNEYCAEAFDDFAERTYAALAKHSADMPDVLQQRLPRMIGGKFLHGYLHPEGMRWVLDRFSTRITTPMDAEALADYFFQEIHLFEADFRDFFPELLQHVHQFRPTNAGS